MQEVIGLTLTVHIYQLSYVLGLNLTVHIYQLFYVSDRHSVSSQGTLKLKKVQSTTYNVYLFYAMQCVFMSKNPIMVIHSALFNLVLVWSAKPAGLAK